MRTVEPARPVEWLKSGFETVFKNPVAFLVMGLIYGVLSFIPLLNFITMLMMPALLGGMQYAARKQDAGQTAEIGDLFAAFQQPGKIGPMILLVLPLIAIVIVMIIIVAVMVGGSFMALAGGAGDISFGPIIIAMLLCLPLGLLAYATLFTSVSRVMFDGAEPFAACKESVQAVFKNIVPIIVLFVLLLVIGVLGAITSIIPILGPLLFMSVLQPVMAVVTYRAYQDIFGMSAQSYFPPVGPSGPSGPFGPPGGPMAPPPPPPI